MFYKSVRLYSAIIFGLKTISATLMMDGFLILLFFSIHNIFIKFYCIYCIVSTTIYTLYFDIYYIFYEYKEVKMAKELLENSKKDDSKKIIFGYTIFESDFAIIFPNANGINLLYINEIFRFLDEELWDSLFEVLILNGEVGVYIIEIRLPKDSIKYENLKFYSKDESENVIILL